MLHDPESAFHCAEQGPDGVTVGGDFNLNHLVAITVDGRVVFASLAVDILRDIKGVLVPLGAESLAGPVNFVWVGTRCTVGGVMGEPLHHVCFIVTRQAGVHGRTELNPRPEGPHSGYGGAWAIGVGGGWSILSRSLVVVGVVWLSSSCGEGTRRLPRQWWRVVVTRLVRRVGRHFG